jgi:hypothetical protein
MALTQLALVRHELGDSRGALRTQIQANQLVDHKADPKLSLICRHNGIRYLLGMGRPGDAWKGIEDAAALYEAAGDSLMLLRRRYLRAKVAMGFGNREMDLVAESDFLSAAGEAADRELPYEAAKVLLDLAGLYASRGRYLKLPSLVRDVLGLLDNLGIGRESLAARSLMQACEERSRCARLIGQAVSALQAQFAAGSIS